MKLNVDDAVRYMGAGKGNAEIREMTAEIAEELEKAVKPRFTWRTFHIEMQEGGVLFREAGEILPGKLAVNMLQECETAVLMVCTLGAEFDAMQRAWSARDMARAVVLDACGSALVEAGCDAAEEELAGRFPGMYRTDRFSSGYGDIPLETQDWILRAVDAGRRLGVTVTASCLMIPSKSVTAVTAGREDPRMRVLHTPGGVRVPEKGDCVWSLNAR